MEYPILVPEKLANKTAKLVDLFLFLQLMVNRFVAGGLRYGAPKRGKMYLTKLKKELAKYEETGNKEQLINIANYAVLESLHPEHPKPHFNNLVDSVWRS